MTTKKPSRPYIFKHAATGKWLELWIDGWYLTNKKNEATRFHNERSSKEDLLTKLTEIFRGEKLEMVFLEEYRASQVNALQPTLA